MSASFRIAVLSVLAAALAGPARAADPAGEVEFARGAATAQRSDGAARLIGSGAPFYTGEVLTTAEKSYAVVRLADGSRLTLRPNTRFVVESLNAQHSERASGLLRLFQGGVRVLTGFISKLNPGGLKLATPVATMGVRGTEFDARLCNGDCPPPAVEPGVATAAFVRGRVEAEGPDGRRTLASGAALRAGETIQSGADGVAVLVFADESRITLQPRSAMRIRRYDYRRDAPEQGEGVLELLRGGLRAVTGLLGRLAPQRYQVVTPVATIGVRGTGFDLLCRGDCARGGGRDGLYAYVWDGAIDIGLPDGRRTLLEQDRALFIGGRGAAPMPLPQVPDFLRNNPYPRPDAPLPEAERGGGRGLYVAVYDGEVALGEVVLRAGEGAFGDAEGGRVLKLERPPVFLEQDRVPRPRGFKPAMHRLLQSLDAPEVVEDFECQLP